MSGVPYTFATQTSSIPLSQLDVNFSTPATLGNTTVSLGNTVTNIGNLTLTNPTLTNLNTPTMASTAYPAFSAYLSGSQQNITSSVTTVLQANSKEYDTAGCYNNTSSSATLNGISVPAWSFAPNIAGYYQVNMEINGNCTSGSFAFFTIYKNGSEFKRGFVANYSSGNFSQICGGTSALIYLNGTSDYITAYGAITGTSPNFYFSSNGSWSYFQAAFVRST